MKKFTAVGILAAGGVFLGTLLAPSASADHITQVNGASGLVAAVVGVAVNDTDVEIIDSSFNNNDVLNNVLNNSRFLNNLDIQILTVEDVLNGSNVNIEILNDVLYVNDVAVNVDIDDIVAIVQVLGGGVLVLV